jgi:hypothetical protein
MTGPRDLPGDVRDATDRHLTALDAAAPGLVEGLYLTGSVTLGDYQPGRSDVDFMAFTARPAGDPEVVALLARVHESLGLPMKYDGNYVASSMPAIRIISSRQPPGDLYPGYEDLLSAALAWRATGDGDFTYGDCIRGAELALDLVADANRRWG